VDERKPDSQDDLEGLEDLEKTNIESITDLGAKRNETLSQKSSVKPPQSLSKEPQKPDSSTKAAVSEKDVSSISAQSITVPTAQPIKEQTIPLNPPTPEEITAHYTATQISIEEAVLNKLQSGKKQIASELRKRIIGQEHVVEEVLIALFAGGHCLITGVPGLAKTLLIRSLGDILDLSYKRIQFTPDLMPADITGIDVIEEDRSTGKRSIQFIKGPIFANIILADEINRTPPKTQAALLEAMQEYQVTAGGKRFLLEKPFFVLATQNPIELEGTYPLPEAQLDRFMFNVVIDYLPEDEELAVALMTTSQEEVLLNMVMSGNDITDFHKLVKKVYVPRNVAEYAVKLVRNTRPGEPKAPEFIKKWVNWGAGLRAVQYLLLGSKVRAVFNGRYNAAIEDIRFLSYPVMRHRVLTNFYAESEGVNSEKIIAMLLDLIPEPTSGLK
jgi:MoxR-like ATPase